MYSHISGVPGGKTKNELNKNHSLVYNFIFNKY